MRNVEFVSAQFESKLSKRIEGIDISPKTLEMVKRVGELVGNRFDFQGKEFKIILEKGPYYAVWKKYHFCGPAQFSWWVEGTVWAADGSWKRDLTDPLAPEIANECMGGRTYDFIVSHKIVLHFKLPCEDSP